MPSAAHPPPPTPTERAEYRGEALAVRSVIGGALMGLANLVPGISGGTMLLAVGVYPQFISGVAEVSTFRFRPKTLLMLACVIGAAMLAIAGFARIIGALLDDYQWAMYSIFIGLTLGGVPILWRMLRPADGQEPRLRLRVVLGSIIGIAAMAALVVLDPSRGAGAADGVRGGDTAAYAMLILAGICGGAAMILPGLSGAYLLLILGQYRIILDAISLAADGVRGGDWAVIGQTMHVFVPVGIGVAVGVVGLSNLMKMLLVKFERPTLGFLLGLLLGAVIGLWPFTGAMPDEPDVMRAVAPTARQAAVAVVLVLAGFGISWGVSHLGSPGGAPGGARAPL